MPIYPNLKKTLATIFLAGAMVAAPVMGASGTLFDMPQAFAGKGGNGGGKGGNGGNGGGKSSQSGNKGSKSTASSRQSKAAAKAQNSKLAANVSPDDGALPKNAFGKLRSKLGALNAANASAQAFANASPNSRVGRIAAYYRANEAATEAKNAYSDAVANEEEIAKQLQDAKDALDAALNPPDGVDPPTTEEIQALEDKVAELEKSLEDAQKATADAETAMNDAEADAVAALEDAANKPVDDEVRAEVDRLLDGKFPPADPDPVTTDPSGAI